MALAPGHLVADRSGPDHRNADRGRRAPGPTATRSASPNRRSSTRPRSPSCGARPRSSLVVGGEARAWARRGGEEADDESRPPDATVTRPPDFVAPIEISAGIVWPPVQQYALIENALAHHEQQGESGTPPGRGGARGPASTRWPSDNPARRIPASALGHRHRHPRAQEPPAGLSLQQVARQPMDRRPGRRAPVLLGRVGRRPPGVPTDRWIFPHVALHVSEAVTLTARRDMHAWPAMAALGRGGRGTPADCPWPSWRSPRSTRASRPPSGCSSANWASTPRGPRPSPAACRSPGGPSTTSCFGRDGDRGQPAAGAAGGAGTGHHGVGHALQAGSGRVVRLAPRPRAPLMADMAGSSGGRHRHPAGGPAGRHPAARPPWPRSP